MNFFFMLRRKINKSLNILTNTCMLEFRPDFSVEEVIEILRDIFDLSGKINPLPSERDQNFLVETPCNEKFVLKIANSVEKEGNLTLQNKLMDFIHENNHFNHPKVVSKNGKSIFTYKKGNDNYYIRLLTYLTGIPFSEYSPKNDTCFLAYGEFLGYLTQSLEMFLDYDDDFVLKDFHWDLKHADVYITKYKTYIKEPKKLGIINYFQSMFSESQDLLEFLPSSVIHNDANDYNVIVSVNRENMEFGIIDFGDTVYSKTIFNLAVGIAYAILDKVDPLQVISTIVKGYNKVKKLSENELKVLFTLIATRLVLSVCISAYQQSVQPDNSYLVISEKPAWLTLILLKTLDPLWVELALRNACALGTFTDSIKIKKWLNDHKNTFNPLIVSPASDLYRLDLGIESSLGHLEELEHVRKLKAIIIRELLDNSKKVAMTEPDIIRVDYLNRKHYFQSNESLLYKNYVPAIEFYSLTDMDVFLPFDGQIFKILINSNGLNTIIFEHQTDSNLKFYSVIENIIISNFEIASMGSSIIKGTNIGSLLSIYINDYPFRYQILCIDQINFLQESFLARDKKIVDELFYNPELIFKNVIRSDKQNKKSFNELMEKRKQIIGPSLSISYKKHLHIVRGYMQYLYDEFGHHFLDAVNNVPHVGHTNPFVTKELIKQSKVLNTNTRYLHELILTLAEKLTSKLPSKLCVCYFVNSGSEANELALRLAENFTQKKDIAVLNHAYHGNTSKLIDISPYKHNGPGGKGTPDYVHILDLPDPFRGTFKFQDREAGKKYARGAIEKINQYPNIGTFIFESYPGVAGQIVLADGYLEKVCETIQKKNIVCIADEVQIGLGRVGTHFWGFETHNIEPDIVTIGKPFGNGHPLGAVVTTKEIADAFNNGMEYFNTFGGNPVSCAVGLAVLQEIEDKELQKNALEVGSYLLDLLKSLHDKYNLIGDVRGKGLYIGVELVRSITTLEPADWEASYIVERLKDYGILTSTDGPYHNVIKIKPPLVFTKENAFELYSKLTRILQESIFK